jgi:hypothetical protein
MFLLQDYHSPIRMNCTKKLWMWVWHFYCIRNK